jgi:monofunctional biosynthetic peptidoglycan transglycosylase
MQMGSVARKSRKRIRRWPLARSAGGKARFRARLRRGLKWLALAAFFIWFIIPAVLTLVYLPSFVHPISTLMLGRYATGKPVERRWIPLEEISPLLTRSVLMSEDGRFCSHFGIDLVEMKNVVVTTLQGGRTRGASTLSMQTARNLFLTNSRTLVRKIVEIPLAIHIDLFLPKSRIMEIYLNIAEWGEGTFGAEAAARRYFKTSAANLTPRQAALLAAALPNPFTRNPARPNQAMRRVSLVIESRAAQSGGYVDCLEKKSWWPL